MDRQKWQLIHRREDRDLVWRYEPLSKNQIKRLRKKGWRVIKC